MNTSSSTWLSEKVGDWWMSRSQTTGKAPEEKGGLRVVIGYLVTEHLEEQFIH